MQGVRTIASDSEREVIGARILAAACILVLCVILFAGLRPFHAPRNAVAWLDNTNGLRLNRNGTIRSVGALRILGSPQGLRSCSLEVWLQPDAVGGTTTLLAFFKPENPLQFVMEQNLPDLKLQREDHRQHTQIVSRMYVNHAVHSGRLSFITITSGELGTKVYVDGTLLKSSADFRFSINDLTGQLVIGTSPVVNNGWSGALRGLAIYDQELTAGQVRRQYETWATSRRPQITDAERNVALFLFEEHQGEVIHNQRGPGFELYIPERYTILRKEFLAAPWTEFHLELGYFEDILLNIAGFVPLGFFLYAYWSATRQIRFAAIGTVILGAAVSLTIEVLQSYLPTRASGVTDLITNTFGTYLGVALYRWNPRLTTWGLNLAISIALRCLPSRRAKRVT